MNSTGPVHLAGEGMLFQDKPREWNRRRARSTWGVSRGRLSCGLPASRTVACSGNTELVTHWRTRPPA